MLYSAYIQLPFFTLSSSLTHVFVHALANVQLSILHPGTSQPLTHLTTLPFSAGLCTDKKVNKIFLIYKEIQSEAVAKSYIRKGFLIYEKMRKYFPVYEEADSHMTLQLHHYEFPYI
jgi:hypothetical protein